MIVQPHLSTHRPNFLFGSRDICPEWATIVASQAIALGDPVPWFSARSVAGTPIELQVNAGRWIVLSFNGPATEPRAITELQSLINQQHLFNDDKLIAFGILIGAMEDLDLLAPFCSPALSFIADSGRRIVAPLWRRPDAAHGHLRSDAARDCKHFLGPSGRPRQRGGGHARRIAGRRSPPLACR